MYNINAKSTQARQSYKPRAEGATLPRNFQFRIWDNKEKDWGGENGSSKIWVESCGNGEKYTTMLYISQLIEGWRNEAKQK